MTRLAAAIALFAATAALAQTPAASTAAPQPDAQPEGGQTATLTVRSSLVVVPALVRTKSGQLVYTLKAKDFLLTDNGVPQRLHLEQDTGGEPLALVICVETGGTGADHLADYQNLGPMLDAMVGNVEHKVAVVGFDSKPVLLHGFTPNIDFIANSLNTLDPGDQHAAVLDAIAYSIDLLRQQPTTYRRAILLLSETLDEGSHTTLVDALHAISDTNTAIYSVGFNSTRAAISHEGGKLSSDEPGPEHGCFSRDYGVDADGNPKPPPETPGTQDFDCLAQLLPPLRLAKMAEVAARNGLRRDISKSVARLTGGEFFKFSDTKNLQRDLFTISNHIPNRYILTFHPENPAPGFHTIVLKVPDYAGLSVEARNGYWVDEDGGVGGTPTPAAHP
jgi:VWFA-related protein